MLGEEISAKSVNHNHCLTSVGVFIRDQARREGVGEGEKVFLGTATFRGPAVAQKY